MFRNDTLDLAPAATRPTPRMWLVMAGCACLMLGATAILALSVQDVLLGLDAQRAVEVARARAERSRTAAREALATPQGQTRAAALKAMQARLDASWSGLFDALEHAGGAVHGGVSVASLRFDSAGAGTSLWELGGIALSDEALLDYVFALQRQRGVGFARLVSQEPGASLDGSPTTKFRLAIGLKESQ